MKTAPEAKQIAEKFFTPREFGALFKMSKSSVYRLMENGVIPYFKIGGCVRLAECDVERFLERVRVGRR